VELPGRGAEERAGRDAQPMEAGENLRTIAEIAISLAGFTGIVAVLGRRARGEWTPLELLRLRLLLETSLGVLFCSFLPALLLAAGVGATSGWRVANLVQALLHSGGLVALRGRVHRLDPDHWPPSERRLSLVLVPVSLGLVAAQLLVAAGPLAGRGYLWFLLGLVYLLFLAVLHFVVLLFPEGA
jgi:hypothetical protein